MTRLHARVRVETPSRPGCSYDIVIKTNVWSELAAYVRSLTAISHVAIITDSRVRTLYGKRLMDILDASGVRANIFSFAAGERSKTNVTKNQLDEQMARRSFGRDSLIIALGGGVVGDMAGFVASTYYRGIPFIQVPTTLLAMVDSSVGGKTGIDISSGKNLIGSFWHPLKVFIDPEFLKTLPKAHVTAGLLEALKMVILFGPQHIKDVSSTKSVQLISRVLAWKAGVVGRDEREGGERMILNFGHTIGHALERVTDYRMLHGVAVGYGMLVEAKISELLGILPSQTFLSLEKTLNRFDIFGKDLDHFSVKDMIAATTHDKKNRGGGVRYVLLKELGKVHCVRGAYAHVVSDIVVRQALSDLTRQT